MGFHGFKYLIVRPRKEGVERRFIRVIVSTIRLPLNQKSTSIEPNRVREVREIGEIPGAVREISSYEICSSKCQSTSLFQYQVLRVILLCPKLECLLNCHFVFVFIQSLWRQIFSESHFAVCSVSSWPKHPLNELNRYILGQYFYI